MKSLKAWVPSDISGTSGFFLKVLKNTVPVILFERRQSLKQSPCFGFLTQPTSTYLQHHSSVFSLFPQAVKVQIFIKTFTYSQFGGTL